MLSESTCRSCDAGALVGLFLTKYVWEFIWTPYMFIRTPLLSPFACHAVPRQWSNLRGCSTHFGRCRGHHWNALLGTWIHTIFQHGDNSCPLKDADNGWNGSPEWLDQLEKLTPNHHKVGVHASRVRTPVGGGRTVWTRFPTLKARVMSTTLYVQPSGGDDRTWRVCHPHQGRAHFKQRVGRRTVVRFHV